MPRRFWAALACMAMLDGAPTILVEGHRGARAMRPENTIPAFEYAIGVGADVLELDMAVTRDNVVVVSHDPHLEPPICIGPGLRKAIHSLTLSEVREWDCGRIPNLLFPKQKSVPGTRIPTLDEVFDLAPKGKFLFNIETKIFLDHPDLSPAPDEFARLVLEVIRKHKLESRVILQSFDFRTLHAMKGLAPEIRRAALYEGGQRDFIDLAHEANASIVSPDYSLVTPEKVEAAHAAGLQVVPWTVDKKSGWDRMIQAQVDGIITDDPAALIAYLKSKGLR